MLFRSDFDVLANEFELDELLEWGFTEYDFQLAGVDWGKDEPPADPGPQVDRAEELQQKWQVQRGQVWEIASKAAKGKPYIVCDCGCEIEL